MFKKTTVVNQQKLRGDLVKRLRRDAQLAMSLSDELIDVLLPPKADVLMYKLSNRALAYGVDGGNPLLFDPEGEGDLYPTVYLLWQAPHALAALTTHSEVSPKILGGADLMLQGVITPPGGLGAWEEGDQRAVVVQGNEGLPFAVGTMLVSSASIKATGLKGRGLKLLHQYPDALWAMGDKSVPDASFTPERIYALGAAPQAAEPSAEAVAAAAAAAEAAAAAAVLRALSLAAEAAAEPPAAPPAAEPGAPTAENSASPEGMDALLDWCLLRGLCEKVGDTELPVKCEELYSKMMLPCRPTGTTADIKRSAYKKLTKLFSVWEKKGLITVKAIHKIVRPQHCCLG